MGLLRGQGTIVPAAVFSHEGVFSDPVFTKGDSPASPPGPAPQSSRAETNFLKERSSDQAGKGLFRSPAGLDPAWLGGGHSSLAGGGGGRQSSLVGGGGGGRGEGHSIASSLARQEAPHGRHKGLAFPEQSEREGGLNLLRGP